MTEAIRFKFHLSRAPFELSMDTEIPGSGITAFYGRSGSGKTTLIRCIAGLEKPANAFLSVHGKTWHDSNNKVFIPPHARSIGYVFQEGALFPHMTVKKNLYFGYQRTPKELRKADFHQIVDLLNLGNLLDRSPAYLSGGEKQRVAIGRALLNHPRLLLMDEPMASIDQEHKWEVLPYLEALHKNINIPVIYITHDREEMVQISNYLVLIEQGKIVAQGEINQMLTRVDLPIAREHEAAAIIEARVVEQDHTFYLTKLAFAGGELFINWVNRNEGSQIRIRVLAKDVSIALDRPEKTSVINIFPAIIEEMQAHGRGRMVLKLNIGGVSILSRITQKSHFLLGLKTGDRVFAQIKSVALIA